MKAFRDTWELGIHSYLSYLRDRLVVSRELLALSGSIFVQIGDENVHLVRSLLDEVFGSANFISLITFNKTSGQGSDFLYSISDYLLWYARDRGNANFRRLFSEKRLGEAGATKFNLAELPDGSVQPLSAVAIDGTIPKGVRLLTDSDLTGHGFATTTNFAFKFNGTTFLPKGHSRRWKTTQEGMAKLVAAGRVFERGHSLRYKRYLVDFPIFEITNTWTDVGGIQSRTDPKIYVVQTTNRVIERCILMTTDPGDLVIDPTCGSGTTAYVAEQWGRWWITIDTSRVALALARQRLMAAKLPYYILTDSPEGARQLAQQSGRFDTADPMPSRDLRKGFVYKTVPHVTLKSIANNPDIRDGMSREDIDTAMARHADQEILYDQPYEDRKVVRVTGPFTVESLSPHVTLPLSGGPANDGRDSAAHGSADDVERFQRVVLDHLRKAGVQNTVRSERLMFDSVEPWPGRYAHAVGTYSESGVEKRAAISIGPEYGTVDAELVHQAAREAVDFADLLIVCGFAFDGYIAGEFRKLGRLTILKAAMNPDLAMGDELLKKTGSGNLFMVFGEPDIEARTTSDGLWEIEVRGVDVYNPTTGEIRSHSTDDIACWFIDTSYDGNSFFVRHAYFSGGNEPYESLKRALRADIDEEAWNSLYRTTSRPFPAPDTGRIAVKVINHYGDEVMKVLEVGSSQLGSR